MILLACWLLLPRLVETDRASILLETFSRYGLGFTHLPFLTTIALAPLAWLVLLGWKRQTPILMGWIVTFLSLEMTPFTGFIFQNDHFRAVVLILSWLSLGYLFSQDQESRKGARTTTLAVLVFASFMTLWKLADLLRNPSVDLSLVQLAYWIPLLIASMDIVGVRRKTTVTALLLSSIALGIFGSVSVFARELFPDDELARRSHAAEAITQATLPTDTICTDPASADRFAAATPRRIIPSTVYRFLPESDETQINLLASLSSVYDEEAAGDTEAMHHVVEQDRYLPCSQNAWFIRIATKFGLSLKTADNISGCPRELMDAQWKVVREGSTSAKIADVCPWIIVADEKKDFWHLPDAAQEIRLDDATLINLKP